MFYFSRDCLKWSSHRPVLGLPALLLAVICLTTCLLPDGGLLYGQDEKADDEKPKIPPAEKITRTTKDGVLLHCQFYPGMHKKETIPVILIHGWDGHRSQCTTLALFLQKEYGCAVIVPDLRGHGQSLKRKQQNKIFSLRRDRFSKTDVLNMLADLDTCKSFLREQNNDGLLNLNQLCLVGFDVGALLAMKWAVYDWNYPDLLNIKQGRDVQGLVLVSPSKTFKGLTTTAVPEYYTKFLRAKKRVPVRSTMIITSAQGSDNDVARKLHKSLEKFHPPPPLDEEERRLKKDLFLVERDTDRQSVYLLAKDVKPSIMPAIGTFILARLNKRKSRYPWSDRSNPFKESD